MEKHVIISRGNFVWKSKWWSSIPCKNCIRSFDILQCLVDPHLFFKMLPIAKSNSPFLYEQIRLPTDAINQSSCIVKAAICHGNRNNQAIFRLFDREPQQPWLTKGGIHLLYDFFHLLKNIRKNWETEKIRELTFYEKGMKKIARWSHLLELYKLEPGGLVKLPKLTEVSVYPKPIERHIVATCLRVFCEETYTAIIKPLSANAAVI